MALTRRIPKLIKTAEIAERWGKSSERVRQILKKENARKVQFAEAKNAPFGWHARDVERIEQKIFGAVM